MTHSCARLARAALALALLGLAAGAAQAQKVALGAQLEGSSVRPGPAERRAGGGGANFLAIPSSNQLCYTVRAVVGSPPIEAHLHKAGAGANGPTILWLKAGTEVGQRANCVDVPPELLKDLLANPAGYYVDVHTYDFPNGAVRGQIAR
jgi:hypothetical protein